MSLRIAINGFGRIGRTFARTLFTQSSTTNTIDLVAINQGPIASENLDFLFTHDSLMGIFPGIVSYQKPYLTINDHKILVLAEGNPAKLPWKELNIDWVVEASGCFTNKKNAQLHRDAGARKVLITAPSADADICLLPWINHTAYQPEQDHIVSLGSCTTNCFATIIKVIQESFGIAHGTMTTVHAYTNDQVLLDVAHPDPRRARAAGINIIPTKTGANKVIIQLFPELHGKLTAHALRVPVALGSIIDFTFQAEIGNLSPEDINAAFKEYADGELKEILEYSTLPIVSSDIIGNSYSAIFDSLLTQTCGSLNRVFAWYDNEFGYSCRLRDFLLLIQSL